MERKPIGFESIQDGQITNLRSRVIETGSFKMLSESEQLNFFELFTAHSREISERVCKHIESSGVTDFFDVNFWEEFFKAESKVIEEEQEKDIDIVQYVKIPEGGKEVQLGTGRIETAKELYGAVEYTLIFEGERANASSIIDYCESRPRLSKVLPHFLFNSLASKGLLEESKRDGFMELFDITTQSNFVTPLKSEPGKQTRYSINNESLRQEKVRRLEGFFIGWTEEQKGNLLNYTKEWQFLSSIRGSLVQEIIKYGSYETACKDKDNTFATMIVADYWLQEYEEMVKKEQLIKGAENGVATMVKYHNRQTDAGNTMGHDLTYALRLREALEIV